jgi:DNA-binding response OmpR family regulator
MLKCESFNAYTTDLGEEGVDLGKLYDYDIILLDLNLPDMSGFEVLRTLRVSKVKTPILILSGLAGIEDKVSGLGYGADDYMTKPFHKDELVARIHAIVRRSRGHAQSGGEDFRLRISTRSFVVAAMRRSSVSASLNLRVEGPAPSPTVLCSSAYPGRLPRRIDCGRQRSPPRSELLPSTAGGLQPAL